MAFDESSTPGGVESRYLGEGFRLEPDFREGPATSTTSTTPTVTDSENAVTMTRRVATPDLTYVFDDPDDGEPGRDRMLVHGVWELLLAVALAAAGYLLYDAQAASFRGDGLRQLVLAATVLGLLAAASAMCLRAGVPNLAVGAIAVAAGFQFTQSSDGTLPGPLLIVLGLCAIVGVVQGLFVTALHVPSWAVSVGVALVLIAWLQGKGTGTLVDGYDATAHGYLWFGGFVGLSVLAGLLGLVPTLRRAFGRFRPVADPARRRGVVAASIALSTIVVSTVLAGLAGALAVTVEGSAAGSDGLALTALALGAALLGGTSAFGRRGGIFGTVLAAALLTVILEYAEATNRSWPLAAVAAVAIGVGLAVTRLVERFGRPSLGVEKDDDEDWVPKVHSPSTPPWSAAGKPATSTTSLNLWASDEAWGSNEGR